MRLVKSIAAWGTEAFSNVLAAEVGEQVGELELGVWEGRNLGLDVLGVGRDGDALKVDLLVSYEPPEGPACLADGPGGVRVTRRTVRIDPGTGDAVVTDTDEEE